MPNKPNWNSNTSLTYLGVSDEYVLATRVVARHPRVGVVIASVAVAALPAARAVADGHNAVGRYIIIICQ